jgi:hypothetical protein
MAQVQAIRSQTIGGGSGSAPVHAASPVTGAPVGTPAGDVGGGSGGWSTTFVLPGSSFVRTEDVREMLKAYAEEVNSNGGRMQIQ